MLTRLEKRTDGLVVKASVSIAGDRCFNPARLVTGNAVPTLQDVTG